MIRNLLHFKVAEKAEALCLKNSMIKHNRNMLEFVIKLQKYNWCAQEIENFVRVSRYNGLCSSWGPSIALIYLEILIVLFCMPSIDRRTAVYIVLSFSEMGRFSKCSYIWELVFCNNCRNFTWFWISRTGLKK